MPIKVVTRGYPGEGALVPLRDSIYRNLNVRRAWVAPDDKEGLRRVGTIAGVIGGPPQARGVIVPPASPAPVLPPAPPPPSEPPVIITPREDFQAGGGVPISMIHEVALNGTRGVVSELIEGPLLILGWYFVTFGAETTNAQWSLIRVDFSESPQLQTFVFNDDGLPTGGQRDGVTLVAAGAIHNDVATTAQQLNQGWYRLIGTTNALQHFGPMPAHLVVPFSRVYCKFYSQNDSPADRLHSLWIDAVRLDGVAGSLKLTKKELRRRK